MRSLLALVLLAAVAPGCLYEHGSGGGGNCVQTEGMPTPPPGGKGAPALAPAPLRNPADLTCTSFGTGCDPACGPCPAFDATAPLPSWGVCGSTCDQLGPTECANDPMCRTVKDADCSLGGNTCITDFLGCFPLDTAEDKSIDCFAADAWNCSRSHQCEAHHSQTQCPVVDASGECARPFATCTPAGITPGACTGPITCGTPPPACPSGTTPGIGGGCFTGACIVTSTCPGQL